MKRNNEIKRLVILSLIIFSSFCSMMFSSLDGLYTPEMNTIIKDDVSSENEEPRISAPGNSNVIISFDNRSYGANIKSDFETYGDINTEWNDTFDSITGFSGTIETDKIETFQALHPNATIEMDEVLETQMNYATLQAKAFNHSIYDDCHKNGGLDL